jgi:hypothetical protein
MVQTIISSPLDLKIPGTENVDVVPLRPWTWSKPDILKQLEPKPVPPEAPRPEDIPDPQFMVKPVDYSTGFKMGQLIRLNFPEVTSSAFF